MVGLLALVTASIFFGAAIYVNVAEHPARLALDDGAALAQWRPAYKRGTAMQAPIAILSALLGAAAWWTTGDLLWEYKPPVPEGDRALTWVRANCKEGADRNEP